MLAVLALIVLAVLIPPYVNVNRYRNRVADAIARALGRNVSVSHIELQLLPRPGLVLSNFEVADDPSYGTEPMLRAGTVTALLRFSSLWRGHLEIGTLEIENPSLNLVRRADGHWNLGELVERSGQVSPAPTSKPRPESRPRFPYVKASAGRINFKLGEAKKAFAFTDADFSLWLESESEWSVRLKGRPVRTDVGISDTGVVDLEGSFRKAESLSQTPVSLRIRFSQGQLGQISKLVFGRDRGWRGSVTSSATLSGTPAEMGITFDGQVDDFRRYDIALGEALRLRVHCTGTYSSPADSLQDLSCASPVGSGILQVRGSTQGWLGQAYDLGLSGDQIPMDRIIAFARHAKKDLPTDLTATGTAEGVFSVHKLAGTAPIWSGGGTAKQVAIHSGVLKQDLELGEVQFAVPGAPVLKRSRATHSKKPVAVTGLRLEVHPFAIPLGAPTPAAVAALFDPEHYSVSLSGDAELSRLSSVARAFGVGTPGIGVAGDATLDVNISGTWAGFVPPAPSGKILVRKATAELQGISEPLQVASANATIDNRQLSVSDLNATFEGGPGITGAASLPVHCTAAETCLVRFDLHTDDVSLARLNQLTNPSLANRPWYHLLAVWQQREDALLKVRASGRISASRFTLGPLAVNNISGNLTLNAGKVHLDVLGSGVLGGHHAGAWNADFTQSPPRFTGSGSLTGASADQLSTLMNDNWATGTLGLKYALSMEGTAVAALRDSADGSATFAWTGGALRHVTLDGRGAPLSFSNFSGSITLQQGKLSLSDCKLLSGNVAYAVNGTAFYDRSLEVRLEHSGGRSYLISGTLDKPHVEILPTPSTEAQLR